MALEEAFGFPALGMNDEVFWRAFAHDLAAAVASLRTDVDHPVSGLDHFEVVLHHEHRVAGVHQSLDHVQQLLDVGKMQAGGRLVEDVERASRAGLGQFPRELHPLGLAARELRGRLAECYVTEPHVDERAEDPGNVRHRLEELGGVGDAHLQDVGDRFPMPLRVERFARITPALAALALDPHVGQEVHFHTPLPETLAGLAPAARNIEGKRPWREPAGAGFRHLREELPNVVEDARVCRRRRARRRAD